MATTRISKGESTSMLIRPMENKGRVNTRKRVSLIFIHNKSRQRPVGMVTIPPLFPLCNYEGNGRDPFNVQGNLFRGACGPQKAASIQDLTIRVEVTWTVQLL